MGKLFIRKRTVVHIRRPSFNPFGITKPRMNTFPPSESQLLRMSLQITISRVHSIHLFQVFALELMVSSDVKYAEENEP